MVHKEIGADVVGKLVGAIHELPLPFFGNNFSDLVVELPRHRDTQLAMGTDVACH